MASRVSRRRGCSGAGDALQAVYYSPYATVHNSEVFWNFYDDATSDVPSTCRLWWYEVVSIFK